MILVDANVLLDLLTAEPRWVEWSVERLRESKWAGPLAVNPIICAEIAPAFDCKWERLDGWLQEAGILKEPLPFAASTIAAAAHLQYIRRGGRRSSVLPDFYIGAHAEEQGHTLLTRDAARYRTYFPKVPLICPAERIRALLCTRRSFSTPFEGLGAGSHSKQRISSLLAGFRRSCAIATSLWHDCTSRSTRKRPR
jgi:predicted nucleic acid-binding protein